MKYNDDTGRYDIEDSDLEVAIPGKTDPLRPLKIAGIVFVAPFVIVMLVMTFLYINSLVSKNNDKNECTEKVDAEVVRYIGSERTEHYTDSDGKTRERTFTVYTAVFRFIYNGTEYTVESGETDREKAFSVGDRILLMIDPDDPYKVYAEAEDRTVRDTLSLIAVIVLPIVIFLVVPFVLFKIRKKREDEYYASLPPEERERALKHRNSRIF